MSVFGVAVALMLAMATAQATEMVYQPVNPSFGGNPGNGTMLLNNANAQNSYKAPSLSAVEKFNKGLEQAILNRLEANALNYMFGTTDTLKANTYETGTFTVVITDVGGGRLQVETIEKGTGATATFTLDALGTEQ